jgi:hypothetical protein
LSARKSGFEDQSEAASHKAGSFSRRWKKSGSTEVLVKKRSGRGGFVESGQKILLF